MSDKLQRRALEDMMKRPIPRKWVGIVRLQMVREGKVLYGTKRFTSAVEAVEMVRPMFSQADREMMLVMSVNAKLEPMAVEIVAVGGVDSCAVDVKNIFKHALLNNASYIICFHNHPSGYTLPSREDEKITERLTAAGHILNLPMIDHIIVGEDEFYSFKEHGKLNVFPE
ncbi:DNA repair protein RadC [Clostridium sp. MCC344]|nr:JAB domain-containing protein [Clostridium sp. MCC344]MBT9787885.1 DNA repair protein RadC [Clostridium sp. MCC344]